MRNFFRLHDLLYDFYRLHEFLHGFYRLLPVASVLALPERVGLPLPKAAWASLISLRQNHSRFFKYGEFYPWSNWLSNNKTVVKSLPTTAAWRKKETLWERGFNKPFIKLQPQLNSETIPESQLSNRFNKRILY